MILKGTCGVSGDKHKCVCTEEYEGDLCDKKKCDLTCNSKGIKFIISRNL